MSHSNIVTVFIASSFEMRSDRIALGDCIRQLDNLYESRGIRIRLHCWEDYKPEYTGERKQDEYNRDLVMSSQIIVGLFKSICGAYTQEEIKLGIASKGEEHVHCFYRISEKDQCLGSNIADFFYENKIQALPYQSLDAICREVSSIVEEYINKHGLIGDISSSVVHWSKVYATIPDGLQSLVPELGNVIRQLDYICERNFNMRCKLWTLKSPQYICNSDYYITIYDKGYSEYDIYELTQANMARTIGQMNALAVYSLPDSNIKGHKLQTLLEQWGHFPIRLENLDVLRLNTLIYLISNLNSQTPLNTSNFITLYNDQIRCHGLYVAPIGALNLLKGGLLTNDAAELKGILDEMHSIEEATHGKIFDNPTQEYIELYVAKERLQERLTQYVCLMIDFLLKETECSIIENQGLRDLYQRQQYKVIINEVDTKALVNSATYDIQLIGNRKMALNAKIEQFDFKIKSLLSVLMSDTAEECYIKDLRMSLDDKLSVQEYAYKIRLISESEIINTLHLQIQVADTWRGYSLAEEDQLYEKLVLYADYGNLSDIKIENLRGNHANALSRAYRYQEAFEQYEIAINHILELDEETFSSRKAICRLFMNYISCYDEYYDNSHLIVLDKWKVLVEKYVSEDKSFIIELAKVYAKEILHLPMDSGLDVVQISQVQHVLDKIIPFSKDLEENDLHDVIHIAIVLACYHIDRFDRDNKYCLSMAYHYLDVATQLCGEYQKVSLLEAMQYRSQINHNLGFLLTHISDWVKAEKFYLESYKDRELLSSLFKDEESKSLLAETGILLSDCYLNQNQYAKAEHFAKIALEIYDSLKQEGIDYTYMNFYKALQMLGSVYMYIPIKKGEGLSMLKECWDWAESHPSNTYQDRFRDVSYAILKENGRIV